MTEDRERVTPSARTNTEKTGEERHIDEALKALGMVTVAFSYLEATVEGWLTELVAPPGQPEMSVVKPSKKWRQGTGMGPKLDILKHAAEACPQPHNKSLLGLVREACAVLSLRNAAVKSFMSYNVFEEPPRLWASRKSVDRPIDPRELLDLSRRIEDIAARLNQLYAQEITRESESGL